MLSGRRLRGYGLELMTACCCIDVDETADLTHRREIKRARKPHKCCECQRTIPTGAPYRYESVLYDGRWSRYHTCRLCASVRDDRFSCGWHWGGLWEELRYCLEGLTGCACEDECDCESWLDPPTWPIRAERGSQKPGMA